MFPETKGPLPTVVGLKGPVRLILEPEWTKRASLVNVDDNDDDDVLSYDVTSSEIVLTCTSNSNCQYEFSVVIIMA